MKQVIPLLFPATTLLYFPMFLEEFETPKAYALVAFGCFSFFWIKWWQILSDRVTQAMFLFVVSACISTVYSIDQHISIYGNPRAPMGLLVFISWFALYLTLTQSIRRFEDAKKVVQVVLWCSAAVSVYAMSQLIGFDFKEWNGVLHTFGYTRPMSTLGHPNFMAGYLAMVFPFTLWAIDNSEKRLERISLTALAVVNLSAIFFSQSRGMFLALVACVITYFALTKERTRRLLSLFCGAASVIVVALLISSGFRETAVERFGHLLSPGPARIEYLKSAVRIWKRYPVFGIGTDAYEIGFQHQRTPEYWQIEAAGSPHRAHNDFLNTLATQGLFGAISALLLTIAIFFRARSSFSPFAAPAIAAIVAFYVEGLTSFTVISTGTLFVLCLSLLSVRR